jgi:cytochrome b involved in lipid metabolism
MNPAPAKYDYVIIGGGLTGCYLLHQILARDKTASCLLLEAGLVLGGRISTVDFKDTDGTHVHYEAGGARFSDKHIRVNKLLKKLGLYKDRVPISSNVQHVLVPANKYAGLLSRFTSIDSIIAHVSEYIKANNIKSKLLQTSTLTSFVENTMKDLALAKYIIAFYEYYSELATLNLPDALNVFQHEFTGSVQYYVLANGYGSIISGLESRLKEKYSSRHKILVDSPVSKITYSRETKFFTLTRAGPHDINKFYARKVICTVPMDALRKIKFDQVKHGRAVNYEPIWDLYTRIRCQPLYRIYARYPGIKLTDWLPGNGSKLATNLPIKYIIPMDPATGVIMISYTDGQYARYMYKLYMLDLQNNTHKLVQLIYKNVRQIIKAYPGLTDIERAKYLKNQPRKPSWIKHYYWKSGAGYWLPESRNKLTMDARTHPVASIPLYIAGENISNYQAWIEGCLETGDYILEKQLALTGSKNVSGGAKPVTIKKSYTKAEVAKHNTRTNGWLIINKKVYNVTSWISKHPGGDVILAGLGKDATSMFNNKGGTGHSAGAHKLLAKYYIGDLAG